jgi:arsenite methyltransferase
MTSLASNYDPNNPELVSIIDELPLWSAPFGMKLLETVPLRKDIKVLDIGSGLGFPLIEIAMRFGETCEVYGIDPWKTARERAEQKIKTIGLKNVKIIDAVAEDIPFEDELFDLIVSNNGINNVQDFEKSLNEISRVGKKNSDFIFTVNLEETMVEFYNEYKNVLAEKGMAEGVKKLARHIHQKRKPVDEIKSAVEQAGFNIIEVNLDKFHLRFADGTTMLNHFLIKLAFLESWLQILHQKEQTEIFSEVESRLNRISEKEGELKLTVPFALFKCRKS